VLQSFVKTSPRLFQRYKHFGVSGQSSSLKATGYKGYNLSIYKKFASLNNVQRNEK
jgi:hypothetical protein